MQHAYSSPLGTRSAQSFGFITSQAVPVEVVQLTGLLIDRAGYVVRAGAEGIAAKPPNRIPELSGMTRFSDSELQQLATERRKDLHDRPFKWRAALDELVPQLLRSR